MATKKVEKTATVKEKESEFSIVKAIMKVLKLDEAGKITKFFVKEVKRFKNEIRDMQNYLVALGNVYTADSEKLQDMIEDARESVAHAYQAVTLRDVENNDAMSNFSPMYWGNVERAEETVINLEKELEDTTVAYEKEIKATHLKIEKLTNRISIIIE